MTPILTTTQKQYYDRDGFLILKHFIPQHVCTLLKSQAEKIIQEFDINAIKSIFSTTNREHEKNAYFLDSGDKIRCFFEDGAIDANGQLKADKLHCINKIGHALHDLDPVFYLFSRLQALTQLQHELGIANPRILQSMYICKQPHFGGEVTCHQDSTYLFTEKEPVTGLWIALEDATLENGCLWAIPGGHKQPLKSRFKRDANNRTSTEIYDETPWEFNKMIPLEVPQGSVIILNGLLPHMSKANTSDKSRHAYSLHVMAGDNEFAGDNWLSSLDSA